MSHKQRKVLLLPQAMHINVTSASETTGIDQFFTLLATLPPLANDVHVNCAVHNWEFQAKVAAGVLLIIAEGRLRPALTC
eukprot:1159815-Pelagomonas_calceolata.AAC.4